MTSTQINYGVMAMLNLSNYGHLLKDPGGCLRLKTTALINADRTFDILTRSSKFKKVSEMKLVDILAVELKTWPEGVSKLTQSFAGMVFYQDSAQQIVPLGRMEISDDFRDEYVTRAEWHAAVDALNAPKVVEWDGEDTPAVGVICEFHESTSGWNSAVVKYSSDHCVVLERDNGYELCIFTVFPSRSVRPIRTAEQVAAGEREKGIQAIQDAYTYTVDTCTHKIIHSQAARLYDAGCRLQVAK